MIYLSAVSVTFFWIGLYISVAFFGLSTSSTASMRFVLACSLRAFCFSSGLRLPNSCASFCRRFRWADCSFPALFTRKVLSSMAFFEVATTFNIRINNFIVYNGLFVQVSYLCKGFLVNFPLYCVHQDVVYLCSFGCCQPVSAKKITSA